MMYFVWMIKKDLKANYWFLTATFWLIVILATFPWHGYILLIWKASHLSLNRALCKFIYAIHTFYFANTSEILQMTATKQQKNVVPMNQFRFSHLESSFKTFANVVCLDKIVVEN